MTALKIKYVHSILTPYYLTLRLVNTPDIFQPNLFPKCFWNFVLSHCVTLGRALKVIYTNSTVTT